MGTKNLCAVLSVTLLGLACESQQQPAEEKVSEAPSPAEQPSAKAEPKAAEAPKPLEGEALANRYVSCWNLYNEQQWQAFGECYEEGAISTSPDSGRPDLKGRDAIIQQSGKEFTKGFSDAKGTPELVLLNGRKVASITLFTGKHDGPLKGADGSDIAATNKQLGQRIFHATLFDQKNEVKQETLVQDLGSMMSQLGLSDAPARAADVAPMAGSPNIVVAQNDATEQANVDLVKKTWQDLENEDVAALEAVMADDIVEADQAAPENLTGKKAVLDGTKTFLAAMGDIKTDCTDIWGAGAYVVSNCNFKATNDGDMGKMFKKTGKSVDVTVVEINKVDAGKIQETWRFMNSTAFAQQLGLIPPPEAAKKEVADNAAEPAKPAEAPKAADAPPAGAPKPAAADAPKDQPVSGQK